MISDALGYLPCWGLVYPRAGGRFAGWVSETEVAGTRYVAVDAADGGVELINPKDCWRETPTTEADARAVAQLPPASEQAVERFAEGGWADEEQGRVFGAGEYRNGALSAQAEQGSGG